MKRSILPERYQKFQQSDNLVRTVSYSDAWLKKIGKVIVGVVTFKLVEDFSISHLIAKSSTFTHY